MQIIPILLDILKYTAAGVGIVWVAFYLIKPYLDRAQHVQLLELKKKDNNSQIAPLRLQAYERMVLFVDRINPANMLVRLNATAYTKQELQSLAISEIRNEFQYNVTQQLYISTDAWSVVKRIKEDTINLLNNTSRALPEQATGMDLSRALLTHLSKLDDNPYDIATSLLRKDLEELFQYGR